MVRAFVGRLELATPEILADIERALRGGNIKALLRYARFVEPFAAQVQSRATGIDRGRVYEMLRLIRCLSGARAGVSQQPTGNVQLANRMLLTRRSTCRLFVVGREVELRVRTSWLAVVAGVGVGLSGAPQPVDVRRATGGLPAHIANQFEEPLGFAEATTGEFVVLDRRAHTVYLIDREKKAARKIIEIGFEKGRVLGPGVLSLSGDDIFAVADAPNRLERIRYFSLSGTHLGGFYLQSRSMPRLAAGAMVLNGVGSMSFTGRTFLISRPETGALLTELDNRGFVLRSVGVLRKTGHESDNDVHLAMNAGLPLAIPEAASTSCSWPACRRSGGTTPTESCCSSATSRARSWTPICRRCRPRGPGAIRSMASDCR